MSELLEFTVNEAEQGKRLDVFLAEKGDMTRSAATRLIENEEVLVSGRAVPKNRKLSVGDLVQAELSDPIPDEAQPENIPLNIVYEDEDIAVIHKPSGMVVHPAAGNSSGTLVNALLYHLGDSLSGIGGVVRPGIVHRIDKDTSGLLVVAKNDKAHESLSQQLKTHTVSRVYEAILVGNLKDDKGTVDAPIGRHPNDRKKMAVLKPSQGFSRHAVTHYEVLERFAGFCLVQCVLETGRTHQIRVHMAHLGHPILGDSVYGGAGTRFETEHKNLIHGQCLHAGRLTLIHPTTGQSMTFTADRPKDTEKILELLRP